MASSTGPRARPAGGVGHYLRDLVYGALDGVVTTLAVVAAADGADLGTRAALILGLANIVADGFSMGASNYLGLKSELEQTGASVAEEKPLRHALATFAAFAVAGAVPLLAFALPRAWTLRGAVFFSALVLVAAGAARAPFLHRGRAWAAAEMLVLGGLAAGAAYVVGALVAPALG